MQDRTIVLFFIALCMLVCAAPCRAEEVPSGTFVGTINGRGISIPVRYESSAFVNFEPAYIEYYTASQFREGKVKAGPISDVLLALRRSNFEPILSRADEMAYRRRDMDHPGRGKPEPAWIDIKIVPTEGVPLEYARLIGSAGGAVQCDSKTVYGLVHCKIPKANGLFEISEYFYDEKTRETFIWCRKTRDIASFCTHMFTSGAPKVTILTTYPAGAHLARWSELEVGARQVVSQFLVK